MRFLYNLLLLIVITVFVAPVLLVLGLRERLLWRRLRQGMGFFRADELAAVAGRQPIWVHAASAGEVVAASPVIKELARKFPHNPVFISVFNAAGYAMALHVAPNSAQVVFFPYDLPWAVCSLVRRVRPAALLIMETELWPNILNAVRRHGVPALLLNGRISERSASRLRWIPGLVSDMLAAIDCFLMQSKDDAARIIRLGADPGRVVVTGNTKFDHPHVAAEPAVREELLRRLNFRGNFPVFVAGSTHAGEEEEIFSAAGALRKKYPDLRLVVAPRQVFRAGEVIAMAERAGFSAVRLSALPPEGPAASLVPPDPAAPAAGGLSAGGLSDGAKHTLPDTKDAPPPNKRSDGAASGGAGNIAQAAAHHDTVVVDTVGDLARLYAVADVVFVGGSLVPQGGHNLTEPAVYGKPVIVGPHMFNFQGIYDAFARRGACLVVRDAAELAAAAGELFADPSVRAAMGEAARAVIAENQGATARCVAYLAALLAGGKEQAAAGSFQETQETGDRVQETVG